MVNDEEALELGKKILAQRERENKKQMKIIAIHTEANQKIIDEIEHLQKQYEEMPFEVASFILGFFESKNQTIWSGTSSHTMSIWYRRCESQLKDKPILAYLEEVVHDRYGDCNLSYQIHFFDTKEELGKWIMLYDTESRRIRYVWEDYKCINIEAKEVFILDGEVIGERKVDRSYVSL